MDDYRTFDLTPWCNAQPGPYEKEKGFEPGLHQLRGLPFQLGSPQSDSHFMVFGSRGYTGPVEVPLDLTAHWIIFAHRLLESHLLEGDPTGREAAVYRFLYHDNTAVDAPVRERFEIAEVPVTWGLLPFLAVPDHQDRIEPRYEGPWSRAGVRQTEAHQAWPELFYLWAWRNPHPDRVIATLRIEPRELAFMLGGLTISSLEEDPLGREPRRPVTITLKDPAQAKAPFDLNIAVDRGVATYPYPLPVETPEAFIKDDMRGWGQPYHGENSPAYVEIAAQPSATVTVKSGQDEIGSVLWGNMVTTGHAETEAIRIQLVDRGKNWVHVTVVDDETGRPVPCRVHFRSPEGIPYQPHGHHDHLLSDMETWHIDVGGDVRLGHVTYAYIDGTCQGWLPRGEVLVDIARGFEYEPLRTTVTLLPGQRELTLRLKRWIDMNDQRWFSGDSHVHFLSTPGAHLEAQGEDLNVVNLLQSQWGHLFTNTEDFVGRAVATPDGRTIVYTSQENRQHMLGHLILMGLKKPVMPWASDGPGEAELGGTLETTLSHWADDTHRQGGVVVLPHFPSPNGEPAALIATGRVDAIEIFRHEMYRHHEYYRYLNHGYRLPLVGGTDKMTGEVPVGLYRTYIYIPPDEAYSYENWCQGIRQGCTFMTSGPMLRFSVDGAQVGDTITLPGNGGTVEIHAVADSIFPIHTLEIIQEGRVVGTAQEVKGARHLELKTSLPIDHHTWLAARVGGPDFAHPLRHHDGPQRGIMAHSSPIYIAVGETWWMHNPKTAQYMLTLLHGGLEYIRTRARHYPPGSVTHHHGEPDHVAFLERPFHQAIAAVNERMSRQMK
jgi:hypothetical protein